jgi:hypothetical protein
LRTATSGGSNRESYAENSFTPAAIISDVISILPSIIGELSMIDPRLDKFQKLPDVDEKMEFLYRWCEINEGNISRLVREIRGLHDRLKTLEERNPEKSSPPTG